MNLDLMNLALGLTFRRKIAKFLSVDGSTRTIDNPSRKPCGEIMKTSMFLRVTLIMLPFSALIQLSAQVSSQFWISVQDNDDARDKTTMYYANDMRATYG